MCVIRRYEQTGAEASLVSVRGLPTGFGLSVEPQLREASVDVEDSCH